MSAKMHISNYPHSLDSTLDGFHAALVHVKLDLFARAAFAEAQDIVHVNSLARQASKIAFIEQLSSVIIVKLICILSSMSSEIIQSCYYDRDRYNATSPASRRASIVAQQAT